MAYALLILIMALAIPHIVAQGAAPLPTAAKEYLEAHNQARAAVGVSPLKWSEELANAAGRVVRYQKNNMGCGLTKLHHKYQGNQVWTIFNKTMTPRMVVDRWVQEKQHYNYATNTCLSNHHTCNAYTLVVWRKSLELGCAQARCLKYGSSITICLYNPIGNIPGERPY
ncbi:STS14 protein-like [Corylus avellana]|uniref:STS14 protein-like n=1 Tax=Corylus avellana TaxID=13451 RepID=UPI001E1EC63D|nr:STS14 protein-like [Corylus avellana]